MNVSVSLTSGLVELMMEIFPAGEGSEAAIVSASRAATLSAPFLATVSAHVNETLSALLAPPHLVLLSSGVSWNRDLQALLWEIAGSAFPTPSRAADRPGVRCSALCTTLSVRFRIPRS